MDETFPLGHALPGVDGVFLLSVSRRLVYL